MKHILNTSEWKRKSHFDFFKNFDNPFFNICTAIEVTELLEYCKNNKTSFFLSSLFLTTLTANEIEEFRYRIDNDDVIIYDIIHPFSTVINTDNIFTFCEFEYITSFSDFLNDSLIRIKNCLELDMLKPKDYRNDVIHYTSIPWIELTSVSHARNFKNSDSIPKIVFGKYYKANNKIMLPISVEVHHALVDGYHVGTFLEALRSNIINCELILNK